MELEKSKGELDPLDEQLLEGVIDSYFLPIKVDKNISEILKDTKKHGPQIAEKNEKKRQIEAKKYTKSRRIENIKTTMILLLRKNNKADLIKYANLYLTKKNVMPEERKEIIDILNSVNV